MFHEDNRKRRWVLDIIVDSTTSFQNQLSRSREDRRRKTRQTNPTLRYVPPLPCPITRTTIIRYKEQSAVAQNPREAAAAL